MISLEQIKAARALLNWTQKDLARRSGISLAAIAQIERGAGNPRAETLSLLHQTFTQSGIAFSDEPGVRRLREPFSVQVWEGREAMLRCWADIEKTLKPGGIVRISPVDDALWKNLYPQEMLEMYARRTQLGLTTLGLLTSPDKNESGWPSQNYRLVPESAVAPHAPTYIYENVVAIIKMRDPVRIIRIENPTLAENFLAQFAYWWENGKRF